MGWRRKSIRMEKRVYALLRPLFQFIGDHALRYQGCCSGIKKKILKMLVRGVGVRDMSYVEGISINKVLSILVNSDKIITPKQLHYDSLEVDEFWTFVFYKISLYFCK